MDASRVLLIGIYPLFEVAHRAPITALSSPRGTTKHGDLMLLMWQGGIGPRLARWRTFRNYAAE